MTVSRLFELYNIACKQPDIKIYKVFDDVIPPYFVAYEVNFLEENLNEVTNSNFNYMTELEIEKKNMDIIYLKERIYEKR